MPSYNEVDGIPSHANRWLLGSVLRGEWGFRGFIVSDYFGVAELERKHHVVADLRDGRTQGAELGRRSRGPEGEGYPTLVEDMQAGRVPATEIDQAVTRVLRAKMQLGLFEQPYTLSPAPEGGASRRSRAGAPRRRGGDHPAAQRGQPAAARSERATSRSR